MILLTLDSTASTVDTTLTIGICQKNQTFGDIHEHTEMWTYQRGLRCRHVPERPSRGPSWKRTETCGNLQINVRCSPQPGPQSNTDLEPPKARVNQINFMGKPLNKQSF